jgi:DNA-binding protein YbaB
MVLDKFKQLQEIKKMRDQAMAIQRQLKEERIEIEENGVKVVMNASQEIQSLEVDGQEDRRVLDVLNKALKRSQEVAAKKLQEMSGGLAGLLGQNQ